MRRTGIKYRERKKGKRMNEEFEKKEECNVLHVFGKILKINNMSLKIFKHEIFGVRRRKA